MTDIDTFIESQVSGMAGGAPPINLSSRENQALASSSSGLLNQGMINGHLGKFTQANYQDILTIT
jgi:hypothetical protein